MIEASRSAVAAMDVMGRTSIFAGPKWVQGVESRKRDGEDSEPGGAAEQPA